MKILYMDQFSDIGGAQSCFLDLLPAFVESGWEVHAALPGNGPLVERVREAAIAVDTIRCGPYRSGWARAFDSARYLLDREQQAATVALLAAMHNFDLIYVNGPRVLAGAIKGAGRIPILFHAHNHVTPRYALRSVARCLARGKARIVACCKSVAATLQPYVPGDRIEVVNNGTRALPFRKRQFARSHPWRVGMIGRIQAEKGQMELLEAADSLCSALPNLKIVFCGSSLDDRGGYSARLRTRACLLPVEFLGWQDNIGDVIEQLDLLVIASKLEGLPRVMLEAFSAGLPVVAFPSGGMSEALQNDVTGFVVRNRSPQRLASRILDVATGDQLLVSAVAANARLLWERQYDVNMYREKIMDAMYRTVTGQRTSESR